MNHAQAQRLWFETLGLRVAQDGAELRALWRDAGLDPADITALATALQVPDPSDRRRELIHRTRVCILHHGLDPDILSTPAAVMRGI